MSHSQTPWKLEIRDSDWRVRCPSRSFAFGDIAYGSWWSEGSAGPGMAESKDNAALIVRAVNSHEALVGALKRLMACEGEYWNVERYARDKAEALEAARAALKLAGE